ncbi:MAG TPA: hypothetical protein VII93_14210, partial [Anaerolineales bacterium]
MEITQEPLQGPNRWKRLFPWLTLVVAVLLLAPPAVWLWQEQVMRRATALAASLGSSPTLGNPALIAQSAHFKILGYENFVGKVEAEAFLARAEVVYPRMLAFLGIPVSDHPVTIMVLPACGISHGGLNYLTILVCNAKFDN